MLACRSCGNTPCQCHETPEARQAVANAQVIEAAQKHEAIVNALQFAVGSPKRLTAADNALASLAEMMRNLRAARDMGRKTKCGALLVTKRDYMRNYMRQYRRRQKLAKLKALGRPEDGVLPRGPYACRAWANASERAP